MTGMSPERDSNLTPTGSSFATRFCEGGVTVLRCAFSGPAPLFSRRLITAIALGGLAAGGAAATAHAATTKAVIELFTSQGCSSCPPADKLIGDLSKRDDLLTLSFNVDYWDYQGWKDTLASPEYSQRQRDYAKARGDDQVYTPQAVIDGRVHVVGSSADDIDAALASNAGKLTVPIDLSPSGDALTVSVGAAAAPGGPHATLWLVMYDSAVSVPIGRGENTGKTITYSDVVRKLVPIAMWKGAAMSVDLPNSELQEVKTGRVAVLLQETPGGLPGPILGAATINATW